MSNTVLVDLDLLAQDGWTPTIAKQSASLAALQAQIDALTVSLAKLDASQAASAGTTQASTVTTATNTTAKAANATETDKLSASTVHFTETQLAGSQAAQGMATATKGMGDAMVVAGVAVAALAVAGVDMGLKFEGAMTKIQTMAGVAKTEIKGMSDSVLNMAAATGESPQKLAQGLYYVVSAGFQGADAMKILEQSTKLAMTAQTDAKVVADVTTSALKAYGLGADQTAHVQDVLTATVVNGKMEFSDLAGSLGRVLPIAAQADVSLEQLGANIASLTQKGLSTAEAVTAVRAAILNLDAPSKQTRDELGRLGLTADDLRKRLGADLAGTLEFLKEKTHGNIDELKQLVPNVRALTDVLGSTTNAGKDTAAILDNITHSVGLSARGWETYSATGEAALLRLKATVEVDLIRAFQGLTDVVGPAATKITDFIDAIGKAGGDGEVQTLVDWLTKLGAVGLIAVAPFMGASAVFLKFRSELDGLLSYAKSQYERLPGPLRTVLERGAALAGDALQAGGDAAGWIGGGKDWLLGGNQPIDPVKQFGGRAGPAGNTSLPTVNGFQQTGGGSEGDGMASYIGFNPAAGMAEMAALDTELATLSGSLRNVRTDAKWAAEGLQAVFAKSSADQDAANDKIAVLDAEAAALIRLRDQGKLTEEGKARLTEIQQKSIPQARDEAQQVNTLEAAWQRLANQLLNGKLTVEQYNTAVDALRQSVGPEFAHQIDEKQIAFGKFHTMLVNDKVAANELVVALSHDIFTKMFSGTIFGPAQKGPGDDIKDNLSTKPGDARADLSAYQSDLTGKATTAGTSAANAVQGALNRAYTATATVNVHVNGLPTGLEGFPGVSGGVGLPGGVTSPQVGPLPPGSGRGFASFGEPGDLSYEGGGTTTPGGVTDFVAAALKGAKGRAKGKGTGDGGASKGAAKAIRDEVKADMQALTDAVAEAQAQFDAIINPDGKNALVQRFIGDINNPDTQAGMADAVTMLFREAMTQSQGGANVSTDQLVQSVWARLSKGVTDPAQVAKLKAQFDQVIGALGDAGGPLTEAAAANRQSDLLAEHFQDLASPDSAKVRGRAAAGMIKAGGSADDLQTFLFGAGGSTTQSKLAEIPQITAAVHKAIVDGIDLNDPEAIAKAVKEFQTLEAALQQESDANPVVITTRSEQMQAAYTKESLNATARNQPAVKRPVDIDALANQIVQELGNTPIDMGAIVGLYLQGGDDIGSLNARVMELLKAAGDDGARAAQALFGATNAAGQTGQLTARDASTKREAGDVGKELNAIASNQPLPKRAVDTEAVAQAILAELSKDPPDMVAVTKLFVSAQDHVGDVYSRVIALIGDSANKAKMSEAALSGAQGAAGQVGSANQAETDRKAALKHDPTVIRAEETQKLIDEGVRARAQYDNPVEAAQHTGWNVPIPGITLEQANSYRKDPALATAGGGGGVHGGGGVSYASGSGIASIPNPYIPGGVEQGIGIPVGIGQLVAREERGAIDANNYYLQKLVALAQEAAAKDKKPLQITAYVTSTIDGHAVGTSSAYWQGTEAELAARGAPSGVGGGSVASGA